MLIAGRFYAKSYSGCPKSWLASMRCWTPRLLRYRLGYEPLSREVADSLAWQRFCRIPLDGQGPSHRIDEAQKRRASAAVDGLNDFRSGGAAKTVN